MVAKLAEETRQNVLFKCKGITEILDLIAISGNLMNNSAWILRVMGIMDVVQIGRAACRERVAWPV